MYYIMNSKMEKNSNNGQNKNSENKNSVNKNSVNNNGRIDLLSPPDISKLFAIYDKIPANQCTTFRNATLGQWVDTPLSLAYFSKENIQIIQNGIRAGVYHKSNGQYVIGSQDYDTLKIIMRSIFLQYSSNLPTNIPGQIKELNKMVLDFAIPSVFGETQGYIKYLYDASTLVVPLAQPIFDSNNDRKNYKMPNWF
jgi:hypothetical protein